MMKRGNATMGRCATCQKLKASGQCVALKELIGKDKDCSFYTDDPAWDEGIEEAVRRYSVMMSLQ